MTILVNTQSVKIGGRLAQLVRASAKNIIQRFALNNIDLSIKQTFTIEQARVIKQK